MTAVDWRAAAKHLAKVDRRFEPLIGAHGLPDWTVTKQPVRSLARSIVYQQLSGKAAATIYKRFVGIFGGRFPSAKALAEIDVAALRGAGLSNAKALAVKDLAAHVVDKRLRPAELAALSDEDVAQKLLPIRGIGPWSVDMFLMFALARPDVLPIGDLGVRKGAQRHFGWRKMPAPEALVKATAPWRPFRSLGSWYMWRVLENPS